jgi:hypothetical protein
LCYGVVCENGTAGIEIKKGDREKFDEVKSVELVVGFLDS